MGGILRDIFTMGARPIALANYLCFGELEAPRMKEIVKGVVAGIAGYGNCVGVPMLTGSTCFDERYNNNVLVNALAVGLITEKMNLALSKAKGVGNWVVYVGAKTGRDGVHGASMASESFGQSDSSSGAEIANKKVNIQIGDPFLEKLLIESCLEVLEKDLVVAMQDMGAAGLISSSFEMASKGQVGMLLDLDRVPLRDQNMQSEEILLSESQERMLLVVDPKNFEKLKNVFHKWGLDAVQIGEILPERKIQILWQKKKIAEIDPDLLTEQAPRYEREYDQKAVKYDFSQESFDGDLKLLKKQTLQESLELLKHPQRVPKNYIFEQYDQRVGASTASDCSESVGAVVLPSGRSLFVALGCRPKLMKQEARFGAMDALLQPFLQISLKGGRPLAVTDCLNFGNPEKKSIMTEFVSAVDAIAEGAEILETPVISGNVSFYNETKNVNIISTPAVGMVGIGESLKLPSDSFVKEGEKVFLIKIVDAATDLQTLTGGLNFLKWKQIASVFRNHAKHLSTARLVGECGVFTDLLRMSIKGIGLQSSLDMSESIWHWNLFYQFIVSGENLSQLVDELNTCAKIEIIELGETKKQSLEVKDCKISNLDSWSLSLRSQLGGQIESLA